MRQTGVAFSRLAQVVLLPAIAATVMLPAQTTAPPITLTGRVTDAIHGTPIPRALVHINSRSVLTDPQGNFTFLEFTDADAYASVVKPGYTQSSSTADGPAMSRITDLTVPIVLALYPDALVTGTLSGRDGQPLQHVGIQLLRANFDMAGLTAVQVRSTQTDSHGNYRFREPAGTYRLAVRYVGSMPDTDQSVVAEDYPAQPSTVMAGYFKVAAGEEKRLDLRPDTGLPVPVLLRVEGVGPEEGRGLRVNVRTAAGSNFSTDARPTEKPGEYRLALPPGAYDLRVTSGNRDSSLEGSARITVTRSHPADALVHMAPLAVFPLDVSFVAAPVTTQSGISQPPTVPQLNLALFSLSAPSGPETDLRPRPQNPAVAGTAPVYEFHVPPGRYRLTATGSGAWTVRSAAAGSGNLLTGELVVGTGTGGSPLRLVASNVTGQLTGTLTSGSVPVPGWLYLIPSEPSLTPYLIERVGTDGTFTRNIAPGNYTALAFANRLEEDLRDPRTLARLLSHGSAVQITESGKATVALTLLTPAAVQP